MSLRKKNQYKTKIINKLRKKEEGLQKKFSNKDDYNKKDNTIVKEGSKSDIHNLSL